MLDANCLETTFREGLKRSNRAFSNEFIKVLNPKLKSRQNVYPHQA